MARGQDPLAPGRGIQTPFKNRDRADYRIRFRGLFRSVEVGEFISDLMAFGSVITDTQGIERITQRRVGLILNFKQVRLEFERVIL